MGYLLDIVMTTCRQCGLLGPEGRKCLCGHRESITLADYYMGRDKTYASELTDELRANAVRLLKAVNSLIDELPESLRAITVTSGWRPAAINAATPGAARTSKHLSCLAVDVQDPGATIGTYLQTHDAILAKHDCAIELPTYTPGWCHIQLGAPPSGHRVFQPYAGPPKQV